MSETQEHLFDEDKYKSDLELIQGKIRHESEKLKNLLAEAEGYISLLKTGPKLILDIFFRCQQTELSAENLSLYGNQSSKLSRIFEQAGSLVRRIGELEGERLFIEQNLMDKYGWVRNEFQMVVRQPKPMSNNSLTSGELSQ